MKKVTGGQVLFMLIIMIPLMIFSAFTITVLWDWFVVTTFQLPALRIPQALGLGLIVYYFTMNQATDPDKDFSDVMGEAIAKPFVFLGLGWVVHLFM